MIACPKCGETVRYSAKYDTAGAHWRCGRCGYVPPDQWAPHRAEPKKPADKEAE